MPPRAPGLLSVDDSGWGQEVALCHWWGAIVSVRSSKPRASTRSLQMAHEGMFCGPYLLLSAATVAKQASSCRWCVIQRARWWSRELCVDTGSVRGPAVAAPFI